MRIKYWFFFFYFLYFLTSCHSWHEQNNEDNQKLKNIIIMIGDGMGFEHINLAKFFQGKDTENIYDSFPIKLAATTFPAISQNGYNHGYNSSEAWSNFNYVLKFYTESAEAATAIATGIKTKRWRIGMDINNNPLLNAVQIAKHLGKSAGVVTSVPISHATPAAFVAHNVERYNYEKIAEEMLIYSQLDVLMGAGHPYYDNDGQKRSIANYRYVGGEKIWKSITQKQNEFIIDKTFYCLQDVDGDGISDEWQYSSNREDLVSIIKGNLKPKRFLFISPIEETLSYQRNGVSKYPFDIKVNENIPTLKEKAIAALEILSKNPSGFFLMIEGGAIDWAAHDNNSIRLIEEQIYFNETISEVINWLHRKKLWENTLLIVVADHECGYLAGGWNKENNRFIPITEKGKGKIADHVFFSTDHTNHLVPFFAKGAFSEKFINFASNIDSVRGYYLDISDIGKFIKEHWQAKSTLYPQINKGCHNQQINLYVSVSSHPIKFSWYKNDTLIENETSSSLKVRAELNKKDFYYCIVDYGFKKEKTNVVSVTGVNCDKP